MDEQQRQELVADLMAALDARGAPDAVRLLDLLRAEQNLVDALRVVRREIDVIVRSQPPTPDD